MQKGKWQLSSEIDCYQLQPTTPSGHTSLSVLPLITMFDSRLGVLPLITMFDLRLGVLPLQLFVVLHQAGPVVD